MKRFLEILAAELDPATTASGVLWGVQRGHCAASGHKPHRAAACAANVADEDEIKSVVVHQLIFKQPKMPFIQFARGLRREFGVQSAAVLVRDIATMSDLRSAGIAPVYNSGDRNEVLDAKLLFDQRLDPRSIGTFQEVIYAAGRSALHQEIGGQSWI